MNSIKFSRMMPALLVIGLMLLSNLPLSADDTPWLDGWQYRRMITVENPCQEELTDYQVQISLGAEFDFAKALPAGGDIRVTLDDGTSVIPSWVESWDDIGMAASIWTKVPSLPVTGTVVYVYYGNPSPPGPDIVEMPPVGPWDKYPTYIVPTGDPQNGARLLAENIVYDDVTGHYWMLFAAYRSGQHVGLVWSDNPDDHTSWNWHGLVVSNANAPHILFHDGLWYIFFADRTIGPPYPISVATSPNIGGPYTYQGPVLTVTEAWEAYRVDEPYVFQRNDGKWILMYMGDSGSTTEQCGYAEADDIMGPYTKFPGNPCIPFGSPGSYDAGTVADPWVIELNDVYYIGYTVSTTKSSPWRTALTVTEDWVTFEKQGVILDWGGAGAWDQYDAFRGAVSRFNDKYYFAYTGSPGSVGNYVMGVATMPVFMEEPVASADDVFEFIDTFDEDDNLTKWSVLYSAAGASVGVSGGYLTMTGVLNSYVQMAGNRTIGTGTLLEAYGMHPEAGLSPGSVEGNAAAEIGYKPADMGWTNVIRMMDWPDLEYYSMQATSAGNNSGYVPTSIPFDTDWHMYNIFRKTDGTVEFGVDDYIPEMLDQPYVPTMEMYPWLMSYARNSVSESNFLVDWIRVRNYCGADAVAVLGEEQGGTAAIFGTVMFSGSAVPGTKVQLMNGDGDQLDEIFTDMQGSYSFADLEKGAYIIMVIPPMGFQPEGDAMIMVALDGTDAEVNFTLVECTTGKVLTYWSIKDFLQKILNDIEFPRDVDFDAYCQTIFDHYYDRGDADAIMIEGVTYMDDPARPLDFDDLVDIFVDNPDFSTEGRIRSNLLVLMMNVAGVCVSQNTIATADVATLSQTIRYLGDSYLDGTYNWKHWYYPSRWQTGSLIPAGFVPLGTPHILYKEETETVLPEGFSLSQNYPNPFNPSTNITFSLPTASKVELSIYNILGQKVDILIDEHREAGKYTVQWDASSMPSGIYFYRLKTDSNIETRKMSLVK